MERIIKDVFEHRNDTREQFLERQRDLMGKPLEEVALEADPICMANVQDSNFLKSVGMRILFSEVKLQETRSSESGAQQREALEL
jgi:hypothetical protein